MHYRFIGIDEGKQNLLLADTKRRQILWTRSLKEYPAARSLQNLGQGRVLAGFDRGYFIFSAEDGRILHLCDRWKDVTSVSRLKDGRTLVTGQDLDKAYGVTVLTLNEQDEVTHRAVREGDYVRLMSLPAEGRYLLSTNERIRETDRDLHSQGVLRADGFLHAWQSLRLENGETLVSAGYGAFMARFSPEGELIQRFGGKDQVPQEVEPFFYASFRRDSRGNILVANWQDHGPGNGHKGRQLLRFSGEGKYLESWSFPKEISSLQGLLIISERG